MKDSLWKMPVNEKDKIKEELKASITLSRERLINEIKAIAAVSRWSRNQPNSIIKLKTKWEEFDEQENWDEAIKYLGKIIGMNPRKYWDSFDVESSNRILFTKKAKECYQEFCRETERLSELNYSRENELNSIFYQQFMDKEDRSESYPENSLEYVDKDKEIKIAYKKFMKDLTPKQRKVFDAHFIKKYTFAKIAKMMKIDTKTAHEHWKAAVGKFKRNKNLARYLS